MNTGSSATIPAFLRVGQRVRFINFAAYRCWYRRHHPSFILVQRDEMMTITWIREDLVGVSGPSGWGAGIPAHFLEAVA